MKNKKKVLDRIEEACNPEREAEVACVVMSGGLCHVCLVTGSVTVTKARIETNIPKKRTGSSGHSKAIINPGLSIHVCQPCLVNIRQVNLGPSIHTGHQFNPWP